MKVLQHLKAAVTRLSHGAAWKRCREHYEQIIEALDDISEKNHHVEWIGYRFPLLKPTTVLQITFLEDVLPVTDGLCPLLQSNMKAFGVISRAANSMLMILEEIKEEVDSIRLKSFKQSEDITDRVSLNEMGSTVAGRTRKQSHIDA